jgi:hypothetical protein
VIRSKNQNFTMGGGKNFDGLLARTPDEQSALNQYSDRFRDYCTLGDPICAAGSAPISAYAHLGYFLEHGEEVAGWVAEKAAESKDKASNSPDRVLYDTNFLSSPVPAILLSRNHRHRLRRRLQQPPPRLYLPHNQPRHQPRNRPRNQPPNSRALNLHRTE